MLYWVLVCPPQRWASIGCCDVSPAQVDLGIKSERSVCFKGNDWTVQMLVALEDQLEQRNSDALVYRSFLSYNWSLIVVIVYRFLMLCLLSHILPHYGFSSNNIFLPKHFTLYHHKLSGRSEWHPASFVWIPLHKQTEGEGEREGANPFCYLSVEQQSPKECFGLLQSSLQIHRT